MALNDANDYIREIEFVDELTKQWGILGREPELKPALTRRCLQNMFSTAYYFPCCPEEIATNHTEGYFQNLIIGAIFAYNENSPRLIIVELVKIKNNSSILVMCEREGRMCEREGFKPWSVCEVTLENDFFIHSNLGSFFDKNDADKVFCIEQGLEWTSDDILS